jgi:hypothetical protein
MSIHEWALHCVCGQRSGDDRTFDPFFNGIVRNHDSKLDVRGRV